MSKKAKTEARRPGESRLEYKVRIGVATEAELREFETVRRMDRNSSWEG